MLLALREGYGTLLDRLRAETRAAHDRIEAVVPLLRPHADEATYRGFLEKLLGFLRRETRARWQAFGARLLAHAADGPDTEAEAVAAAQATFSTLHDGFVDEGAR